MKFIIQISKHLILGIQKKKGNASIDELPFEI